MKYKSLRKDNGQEVNSSDSSSDTGAHSHIPACHIHVKVHPLTTNAAPSLLSQCCTIEIKSKVSK